MSRPAKIKLIIRARAARGGSFTILDFVPELTIDQESRNCRAMAADGELQVICNGRPGRIGFRHAVYSAPQQEAK